MHLGYKHAQGIDGFPRDYSMAYCYYSNVGKQTCADRWTVPMTQVSACITVHMDREIRNYSSCMAAKSLWRIYVFFPAILGSLCLSSYVLAYIIQAYRLAFL